MNPKITILYAFRNRDAQRVRLSLQSLQQQSAQGFEVVFVDYGSDADCAKEVAQVVNAFQFASYHYIAHPGLLWNKSKALNYGIKQAKGAYVLINDVDVILHPMALAKFETLCSPTSFNLFKIGYLSESVSLEQVRTSTFEKLKPSHIGNTFGIGLFPKTALERVCGLDVFFHFYGSEDEDLNARLLLAGFQVQQENQVHFLHLWHPRYPKKKDKQLTVSPRLYNAQRINQQHFLNQKNKKKYIPNNQEQWGCCFSTKDLEALISQPNINLRIPNINALVTHFLREELKNYQGKTLEVLFYEDEYYQSLKYKIKKTLGKQSQPYCSMKEVNDEILKTIVFDYRDHNYIFEVSPSLKEIRFLIAL